MLGSAAASIPHLPKPLHSATPMARPAAPATKMLGSAAASIPHLPKTLRSAPPPIPRNRLLLPFRTSFPLRACFPAIISASAIGGLEESVGGTTVVSGSGRTPDEVKADLYQAMEGINRGIFGATSAKKTEIEGLVQILESQNLTPNPTDDLLQVDGCWRLLYSTISILGSKRTKLGLRDFISLGDFLQTINVAEGKAINEIKFSARGFKMLSGQLTIVASFKVASETRVNIKFESSEIVPVQLMNLFQKNYDLLLAIFNPDGWLEITYVDESLRIGRDDKGNIFILERFKQAAA